MTEVLKEFQAKSSKDLAFEITRNEITDDDIPEMIALKQKLSDEKLQARYRTSKAIMEEQEKAIQSIKDKLETSIQDQTLNISDENLPKFKSFLATIYGGENNIPEKLKNFSKKQVENIPETPTEETDSTQTNDTETETTYSVKTMDELPEWASVISVDDGNIVYTLPKNNNQDTAPAEQKETNSPNYYGNSWTTGDYTIQYYGEDKAYLQFSDTHKTFTFVPVNTLKEHNLFNKWALNTEDIQSMDLQTLSNDIVSFRIPKGFIVTENNNIFTLKKQENTETTENNSQNTENTPKTEIAPNISNTSHENFIKNPTLVTNLQENINAIFGQKVVETSGAFDADTAYYLESTQTWYNQDAIGPKIAENGIVSAETLNAISLLGAKYAKKSQQNFTTPTENNSNISLSQNVAPVVSQKTEVPQKSETPQNTEAQKNTTQTENISKNTETKTTTPETTKLREITEADKKNTQEYKNFEKILNHPKIKLTADERTKIQEIQNTLATAEAKLDKIDWDLFRNQAFNENIYRTEPKKDLTNDIKKVTDEYQSFASLRQNEYQKLIPILQDKIANAGLLKDIARRAIRDEITPIFNKNISNAESFAQNYPSQNTQKIVEIEKQTKNIILSALN